MSFNALGATQLPLNAFGGLLTEIPAPNAPEGASPDNQDLEFAPYKVFSRRGVQRMFATPMGTTTLTYAKTYVDPLGVAHNLFLDSSGNIWEQNSPTTYALLGTTIPASYGKSITAFGREYIAISDGLNSADCALQFDGTNLDRVTQDGPGDNPTVTLITYGAASITGLARVDDLVTVDTGVPHNLLPGYQAIIKNVAPTLQGTAISTIVIANTQNPGLATITTSAAHKLLAGAFVNLQDIPNHIVGTAIGSISRQGSVVTVITTTPHGLSAGALVTTDLVANASFNASFTVAQVLNTVAFTYIQNDPTNAVDATGVIRLNWPLPQTTTPSFFQIVSVPSTTSFTVALNYSDGLFTGGTVTYPWDGTFFVKDVISATRFTYTQTGISGAESAVLTAGETATPFGQLSTGSHQMFTMYLTRQGYLTRPSPPVKVQSSGGQYVSLSNIPIGPPNVIARVFGFTGAAGSLFYYIPVAAQIRQGQRVSTATVVSDNATTAAILDFSDNTLFAALGLSIPGNTVANQIILDGAIGFAYFGSRLMTWGQRNRLQNILNFGFDGGYLPSAVTLPTGWLVTGAGGGALVNGHYGQGWQFGGAGAIYQSLYRDAYGAPIATPNTKYTFRAWVKGAGATATFTISSAATGFSSSATLAGVSATGSYVEQTFSNPMPVAIPTDLRITLTGTGGGIVDEMSVIYTDNPYLNQIFYGSYVNNPEAFDGVTGKFGPVEDTRKVMGCATIRSTLFLLTRDPSGRLHACSNTGVTEPAGWTVSEVGSMCGVLSIFGLTVSQADDATGGGGEEWFSWASSSGVRIFGGDQPWKITQEIQPDWNRINQAAAKTIWAVNDPNGRVIYYGLPIGIATAPNLIYPVNYKSLDTAAQVAQADPMRNVSDVMRKWTRWNLPMNGAAILNVGDQCPPAITFFGGNGQTPGAAPGFGNAYALCSGKRTDDDYGRVRPYYVTYFFTSAALEQALRLGAQRHILAYLQWLATGLGVMKITVLVNQLDNPWPINAHYDLVADAVFDQEWTGADAVGQRFALKFESLPVGGV